MSGHSVVAEACKICVGCGSAETVTGSVVSLSAAELFLRQTRVRECDEVAAAISDRRICDPDNLPQSFPSPFWVASTPLVERLSSAIILPIQHFSILNTTNVNGVVLQKALPNTLPSVLGSVTVNSLFHTHLIEKNSAGAYKRFDVDHFAYMGLIAKTLALPLEVYVAKKTGGRTRFVFLSFYLIDAAWTYHAAIVTRDLNLLTAYRMNGGRVKFLAAREGRLRYTRYDELLRVPTPIVAAGLPASP